MRSIILTLLLLAGCGVTAPAVLSDDWMQAFEETRIGWDPQEYRCSDMAQVWRDYMHRRGAPYDCMRLVSGESVGVVGLRHMWLEVRMEDGWRVFDPLSGNFNILESDDPLYASYSAGRRIYPGRACILGGGYHHYGDRWIGGEWVRK